jgi:hypothetical protein
MAEMVFSQGELEAIAAALGDTSEGLTGSEIGHLLASIKMIDPTPTSTKWVRLHNAFVERQNRAQNRRAILEFMRQSMLPARYVKRPERFEPMRANLNRALAFSGLAVDATGELVATDHVKTLPEAARFARPPPSLAEKTGLQATRGNWVRGHDCCALPWPQIHGRGFPQKLGTSLWGLPPPGAAAPAGTVWNLGCSRIEHRPAQPLFEPWRRFVALYRHVVGMWIDGCADQEAAFHQVPQGLLEPHPEHPHVIDFRSHQGMESRHLHGERHKMGDEEGVERFRHWRQRQSHPPVQL